jgi:hypothetical protein
MAAVNVTIPAESDAQAAEVAAAIREAGTLEFTNIQGDQVNITVGDVTVS